MQKKSFVSRGVSILSMIKYNIPCITKKHLYSCFWGKHKKYFFENTNLKDFFGVYYSGKSIKSIFGKKIILKITNLRMTSVEKKMIFYVFKRWKTHFCFDKCSKNNRKPEKHDFWWFLDHSICGARRLFRSCFSTFPKKSCFCSAGLGSKKSMKTHEKKWKNSYKKLFCLKKIQKE